MTKSETGNLIIVAVAVIGMICAMLGFIASSYSKRLTRLENRVYDFRFDHCFPENKEEHRYQSSFHE